MSDRKKAINMKEQHAMRGLYLVTPNWDDTDKMLDCTRAALHAGAALVQYRHKDAGPALRREQAAALQALCRRYARPLVINDHLDLCMTLDADGVHLGGTDEAVRNARTLLGPGKIVGASCYGELALPIVVIGGMTPENAAPLVARGADMVAAITSVYGAPQPEEAVARFDALFAASQNRT